MIGNIYKHLSMHMNPASETSLASDGEKDMKKKEKKKPELPKRYRKEKINSRTNRHRGHES
jgi:hypothetical protein